MQAAGRAPSALNIAFWNAQGLTNKKQELINYMGEHKIDIMLVNKTHLKENNKVNIRI